MKSATSEVREVHAELSAPATETKIITVPSLQAVLYALEICHGVLSEQEAAKLMDRSPSRFRHVFKELTGETYQAARLRFKLTHAARLLHATTKPISQISNELHYSDRRQLEKAFKRHFGVTPKQYRAQKRSAAT